MVENENKTTDEILELLKEPNFLPTEDQVRQVFPEPDGDLKINMDWKNFFEENKIFQLLTKEMIEDLTTQIIRIANNILINRRSQDTSITIVELGAGDGRLAHFLSEELKKKGYTHAIEVIATDDESWKTQGKIAETTFPVEKLSAEEAVEKYTQSGQTILLSSWMPPDVNWTTQFLQRENVKGIVLIGDVESTGTGEDTWFSEDWNTERLTDGIRGNFGKAQATPNDITNQSVIALVSKK